MTRKTVGAEATQTNGGSGSGSSDERGDDSAASGIAPYRYAVSERLAVSREALWALITDTDRLNRETGLPPARFSFLPRDEGGSRVRGEMRLVGLNLRYDEEPYAWVRPERYSVARHIDNGPLTSIELGMSLAPAQDDPGTEATRVTAWFAVTPRSPLAYPVARTVARIGVSSLIETCRSFAAFLSGQITTPYPKHAGTPPADKERLARAMETLTRRGTDASIAARLAEFIAASPIEDVVMIRPFALADRWGVPRRALLQTCLMGVRAELLEMRWRLLCPACRGAGAAFDRLDHMTEAEAHCPSCNIRFGPEFDRSVEVCFRVAPRIRDAEEGDATYCIGGPGHSPHVALQWPLAPGQTAVVPIDLAPGNYRLVSPQAAAAPLPVKLREPDDADTAAPPIVRFCEGNFAVSANALPASGTWRLENAAQHPVVVRLETPGWLADVATASVVTSLQAFRDSFGSEVLSPGVEIAVRQIAILFSDLKGSTDLYRMRGDAPSYAAVRDHFAQMRTVIDAHGGGIVKTIGDAVMAVFTDPAAALSAALEIQRQAQEPGERNSGAEALVVKLGMHSGPALAVSANGVLDYFGQVVNLAARVQAQSVGGDVVIARALADDAQVVPLLTGIKSEPLTVTPRGTNAPMELLRLWPVAKNDKSDIV